MKKLTIIIPVFNEENFVKKIYEDIKASLNGDVSAYDILFVNDGSEDNTLNEIKNLVKENENVKYVSLSHNFGKEAAIFAGLENAKKLNSTYTCIMDCDGQDPAYLLPQMISKLDTENIDCVCCRRIDRKGESVVRSGFSSLFYKLINKFTDANIPEGARDYIMMKQIFLDALLKHKEKCRFFKGLYTSIGYDSYWIEFENVKVENRQSRWSFLQLCSYALEGIISSSESLLTISAMTGIVFFILSIVFLFVIFFRALIFGDRVAGWPSLVCMILLLFGMQFIFTGIIGLYLSKNYKELKNRPIYLEKESNI